MNPETKKRFFENLFQCITWVGYAIVSIVITFGVFALLAILGGSPTSTLPVAEQLYYVLIGVWRLVFYSLCVASPLLACAAFKTWVLKR